MERFNVDADHAFGLITRLSRETNTPVRTLAGQDHSGPRAPNRRRLTWMFRPRMH
jgi:hypothetical protein